MDNVIEKQLKDMVNNISKNKLGFDVFTEWGINYSEMAKVSPIILDALKERKEVEVEIREKNELDNEEDLIGFYEDNIIILKSPEQYSKFIVDYIMNEFDIINNSISEISKGQHNDRVALINSAIEEYKKALYTQDENYKIESFKKAESLLKDGMNMLMVEMNSNCENILKIPKGIIKKMFCKVTPQNVMEYTDTLRESLIIYENGLNLMLRLSLELNEPNRMIPTLDTALNFIEGTFLQNEKYKVIDSFDYRDDNFWMTKPLVFEENLYKIKEKKLMKKCKVLLDVKE